MKVLDDFQVRNATFDAIECIFFITCYFLPLCIAPWEYASIFMNSLYEVHAVTTFGQKRSIGLWQCFCTKMTLLWKWEKELMKNLCFFYIEIGFSEIVLVGTESRKIRNEGLHNLCFRTKMTLLWKWAKELMKNLCFFFTSKFASVRLY